MMFQKEQIDYLQKHFHTSTQFTIDLNKIQSVEELFDPVICKTYLQQISKEFNTTSLLVVASQFAKRYASMLAPATLYAMSVYHTGLPVNPQNCYIKSAYEHGIWFPKLVLANWESSELKQDRHVWREKIVKQLFMNLSQMWTVLQKTTKIQPTILWENTAVYIHWLYQQQLADHLQAQNDYRYLLQASEEVFNTSFQPLQRFPMNNGCRKTCCLYFLTNETKQVCKGCPRAKANITQAKVRSVVTS